jgi:hypothetical protein
MVYGPKRVYKVGGFVIEDQELAHWLFDYVTAVLETTPGRAAQGAREDEIAENAVLCALLHQNGIKKKAGVTDLDFLLCQKSALKKSDS